MRRSTLAALVAAALGAAPGAVTAQPPTTRLSGVLGVRQNIGGFGDRYGFAMVFGLEASYHPLLSGRLGLVSYLNASTHWEGDDTELNTAPDLWLIQMGFGPRLRLFLGRDDLALCLDVTAEILRSNYTIPPDDRRTYVGPSVGFGIEYEVAERWMLSFGARYGLLANGPGGLAIQTALGYGE